MHAHQAAGYAFNYILALTLAMARIFPCFVLMPVFSFSALKGGLRSVVVGSLSLFVIPTIKPELDGLQPDMLLLAALIMKELLIGILMGLLLALPFWMFESVGALFDNQRGALMGGQINPQLGPDVTPLGKMMQQMIILLLILGLGLSTITQLIWDSYKLWPVSQWIPVPTEAGFQVYLGLLANTFKDMVLYAGPLVALMMLIDFGIATMSIFSPQLQATALAIPVKCLLGVMFFVLYLPLLTDLANERLFDLRDLIHILPMLIKIKGS